MSRLALHGRPFVVFSAMNKDHRRWFANFNQTGAWGPCPVRFVLAEEHGDLITQIQRELIQFYVDKEFQSAVVRKPQKKMSNSARKRLTTT